MSIKRKTTVKNLSAYKKKKINTECPYFQGTSRSKTLYFISVSWSFIYREASESVSLLHEVSLFNFWLNGYTYESLLDKGQSSRLYLTPYRSTWQNFAMIHASRYTMAFHRRTVFGILAEGLCL